MSTLRGGFLQEIFIKNKQIILYLIFGVFTTTVNLVTYCIFAKFLKVEYLTSNILAWIISVVFAYATNKIFVFESKGLGFKSILRECIAFILSRLFSGLLDTSIMFLMVDLLHINDLTVKAISVILVNILNFVLSKLIIFKDNNG